MVKIPPKAISNRFIETVCTRLTENKRVRRSLPEWGRVHIDRQLPFLCVFRRQHENDRSLSERLIMGEASYLTATRTRRQHAQLSALVKRIAQTQKESFGAFLMVEVWLAAEDDADNELSPYTPGFTLIRSKKSEISSTIDTLKKALKKVKVRKKSADVDVVTAAKIAPPGVSPLLSAADAKQLGCHIIGVQIRPIYKNTATGQIFPLVRRELQRGFSRALKNSFFEFTHNHTPQRPLHYQSLGRWSMVKAVWEVDRQLAEMCRDFDFLLQVTPTNSHAAWLAFQRKRYTHAPEFIYRPLPLDPTLAKRRLFQIPIERIEDPTLAQLFREQQLELDRQFTMLIDRDTPRFLYGSLQLYGAVDDALMQLAEEVLTQLSPRRRDGHAGSSVNAHSFAARAMQELDSFRKTVPEIQNTIEVRQDVTGLMVSQGNLLIGADLKIPSSRIEALIQHEVGTHMLTYLNGRAQPLQQLYIGLPGYEELQEGLAVLSEYFVGGLTSPRLRLLAARVVAARHMVSGASFVDVFRTLNTVHGFERRTAFTITMRTFRGGGFTKDAVYLRGLVRLLAYLQRGGALEPLFVGKISADHVGIVRELQWRNVLHSAPLRPGYLDDPHFADTLKGLQKGLNPLDLIQRSRR